ncbi:MAG: hypothetical protein RBU21_15135 [FCB group bacterium]|jgi:hypothetical protein|nr:hypothetical protein [FCB group bacterium]
MSKVEDCFQNPPNITNGTFADLPELQEFVVNAADKLYRQGVTDVRLELLFLSAACDDLPDALPDRIDYVAAGHADACIAADNIKRGLETLRALHNASGRRQDGTPV